MSRSLTQFNVARLAIAKATTIDEIKDIRDKAEALRLYAQQRDQSLEMQNQCAVIKLRAERKAGELIKMLEKNKGGRPAKTCIDVKQVSSFSDLGITRNQAHRWQQEASVSEKEFEAYLDECTKNDQEITSKGLYRIAVKKKNKNVVQNLKNKKVVLPAEKYHTIVIDPPWDMKKIEREERPNQVDFDYPTMSYDELADFKMPAHKNCHLYVWTTQKHLPATFELVEKWGFKYLVTMVWHKPGGPQPFGLPQYNCEFVLLCRKGNLPFLDTKAFNCCFKAKRREHSRKPDEFYELVERVSPSPRIDIFSRGKHKGFGAWGNETGKFK